MNDGMLTLKVTKDEAHAIGMCLSCYMDNEHDKGEEGIGSDLMDLANGILTECADWDGNGALKCDLTTLWMIYVSLDVYQENEDIFPDSAERGFEVMRGLLDRINKAIPSEI